MERYPFQIDLSHNLSCQIRSISGSRTCFTASTCSKKRLPRRCCDPVAGIQAPSARAPELGGRRTRVRLRFTGRSASAFAKLPTCTTLLPLPPRAPRRKVACISRPRPRVGLRNAGRCLFHCEIVGLHEAASSDRFQSVQKKESRLEPGWKRRDLLFLDGL